MKKTMLIAFLGLLIFPAQKVMACVDSYENSYMHLYTQGNLIATAAFMLVIGLVIGTIAGKKSMSCCSKTTSPKKKK